MDKIKHWLEGNRDYDYGLALLMELQPDNANLCVLECGASPDSKQILVESLSALMVVEVIVEPKPVEKAAVRTIKRGNIHRLDPDTLPEEMLPMYKLLQSTSRQAKFLKGKLDPSTSTEANKRVTMQIVRLQQSYTRALLAIEDYYRTGEVPPDLSQDYHAVYCKMIKTYATYKQYCAKYKNSTKHGEEVKRRKNIINLIDKVIEHNGLIHIEDRERIIAEF